MQGLNNYITLDECEDMVIWLFNQKVLQDIQWTTMLDTDKQVYLDTAFELVDSLKYRGYPVELNQETSFPRIINDILYDEPPTKVKECIAYATVKLIQSDNDKRKQLIASGVTEIKVDKLTEKFSSSTDVGTDVNLIKDRKVKALMKGLLISNGLVLG